MLVSVGDDRVLPASSAAIAVAQILACEVAAAAERGIAPAIAASPMTWIFGCSFDSNVTGSTGHQPVRSATPASSARRPAFCGGITLATAASYLSKSVESVRVFASTDASAPPADTDTHSTMPG